MKKILLSAGALFFCYMLNAQLTFVGDAATVTVLNNALVYNGGGFKAVGTGQVNNFGNIMLVTSASTDKFETLPGATSTNNFVLKYVSPTSYGQLYIDGFSQSNLATSVVTKEYKEVSQGAYQQIGIPYSGIALGTFAGYFGKTFSNVRYSQNEILKYNNTTAVSDNANIATLGLDGTSYYMLGAKNVNFNPTATVFTLKGQPFANGQSAILANASNGVNFGAGGNNRNSYNEKYNTYLQDPFVTTAWGTGYAKYTYQYANPYFTNIDLNDIGLADTNGDLVNIKNIVGIVKQPSADKVTFSLAVGSADTQQNKITFPSGASAATGDVDALVLKPLETFTIKLSGEADPTSTALNFDKLRRFKFTGKATATPYSVTAARNANSGSTLKQLGVIALDADGKEVGRTYYVVYNNAVDGHTDNYSAEATASSIDAIGTFEENPTEGGMDSNYASKYWLYINEANEQTFKGKPVAMLVRNPAIKSLKFEVRENASLVPAGTTELSGGEGFYYKSEDGTVQEVAQDASVAATSGNFSLFYGKPSGVLATGANSVKANRTQVVYNPSIDNYIVRFDSTWNKADIKVYDMSGKLVVSNKNVSTNSDFVINLAKGTQAYVVVATSDKGEVATAKIVR